MGVLTSLHASPLPRSVDEIDQFLGKIIQTKVVKPWSRYEKLLIQQDAAEFTANAVDKWIVEKINKAMSDVKSELDSPQFERSLFFMSVFCGSVRALNPSSRAQSPSAQTAPDVASAHAKMERMLTSSSRKPSISSELAAGQRDSDTDDENIDEEINEFLANQLNISDAPQMDDQESPNALADLSLIAGQASVWSLELRKWIPQLLSTRLQIMAGNLLAGMIPRYLAYNLRKVEQYLQVVHKYQQVSQASSEAESEALRAELAELTASLMSYRRTCNYFAEINLTPLLNVPVARLLTSRIRAAINVVTSPTPDPGELQDDQFGIAEALAANEQIVRPMLNWLSGTIVPFVAITVCPNDARVRQDTAEDTRSGVTTESAGPVLPAMHRTISLVPTTGHSQIMVPTAPSSVQSAEKASQVEPARMLQRHSSIVLGDSTGMGIQPVLSGAANVLNSDDARMAVESSNQDTVEKVGLAQLATISRSQSLALRELDGNGSSGRSEQPSQVPAHATKATAPSKQPLQSKDSGEIGFADVKGTPLSQWQARLESAFFEELAMNLSKQIFDLIVAYPGSSARIDDLRLALSRTNHGPLLLSCLAEAFDRRLLQPGAPTPAILEQLHRCTRALRRLDPTGAAVHVAITRVREYMATRPETIRYVVKCLVGEPGCAVDLSGLLDPSELPRYLASSEFQLDVGNTFDLASGTDASDSMDAKTRAARAAAIAKASQALSASSAPGLVDSDVEAEGGEDPPLASMWHPAPTTAFGGGAEGLEAGHETNTWQTRLADDPVAVFASLAGTKKRLLNEYRVLLSQKLLMNLSFETDEEVATMELLKLRFGDESLPEGEVMLDDVTNSKRVAARIAELVTERMKKQTENKESDSQSRKSASKALFTSAYDPEAPKLFTAEALSSVSGRMDSESDPASRIRRTPEGLHISPTSFAPLLISRAFWPKQWNRLCWTQLRRYMARAAEIDPEVAYSVRDALLADDAFEHASLAEAKRAKNNPGDQDDVEDSEEEQDTIQSESKLSQDFSDDDDETAACLVGGVYGFEPPEDVTNPADIEKLRAKYMEVKQAKSIKNLRLPRAVRRLHKLYEKLFHELKAPRRVTWHHSAALVEIELELGEVTKTFKCSAVGASLISIYHDAESLIAEETGGLTEAPCFTLAELTARLRVPTKHVQEALHYWQSYGVLTTCRRARDGQLAYALRCEEQFGNTAIAAAEAQGLVASTADATSEAQQQRHQEQDERTAQLILDCIRTMPRKLEAIGTLLRGLQADNEPTIPPETIQRILDQLVSEGQVTYSRGVYSFVSQG